MRCPSCDHDNPEDATICGECGSSLAGHVTQEDPLDGTPVRLLTSLTEADRARVLERLRSRRVAVGEAVIHQGDPPKGLYIVKSGLFAVTVNDRHGDPVELNRLKPGECFGEMSLLSGEPASSDVRALLEGEVWALSQSDFMAVARSSPGLLANVAAILSERLRASNERLVQETSSPTVLVYAPKPSEWASSLALALSRAVARFSGGSVLALDLSSAGHSVLAAHVDDGLPSIDELVDERRTVGQFSAASGARQGLQVTVGSRDPSRQVTPDETISVLGRLSGYYDRILVFAEGVEAGASPELLAHARDTLVLLTESDLGRAHALARSAVEAGGGAAVVLGLDSSSLPSLAEREALQKRCPLSVRSVVPGGAEGPRGAVDAADRGRRDESAAGRAIDQLARDLVGLKVGLALGVGGSRGYAHLGIIRGLERHGVPVDVVSGCSIGSAVAAGYAAGMSLKEIETHIDTASRRALRPSFPWISILSNRGVIDVIKGLAGQNRFEDLTMPLTIVAVDLVRRQEVTFRRGLVWPAIVGSMAIPGLYPPLRMGRRYLVDGGIISPVPVSAAAALGAQVVIGAKLTSSNRPAGGEGGLKVPRPFRSPLLHDTVARALEIMQSHIVEQSLQRADVTIEPRFRDVQGAGLREFHRAAEFEAAGEEAVEAAMGELRTLFRWVE